MKGDTFQVEHKYIVVENKYEGIVSRNSFGIAYVEFDENTTIVIETISDITSNKKSIENFVKLCNELQLSAVQLQDVVEDFMLEI